MTADDIKVLLVDDEVDFLETLGKRLGKRGLDVEQTRNAEAAMAHLAARPVDVVVLDVRMSGMDGISALRQMKHRWPLMEVIMLTGHASMEAAVAGMELGAFDYLMKPMNIDELVYKIQDAAEKKRIQEFKIKRFEELNG